MYSVLIVDALSMVPSNCDVDGVDVGGVITSIRLNSLCFPSNPNSQPRNRTITCIRALDQYVNGKGGYATLRAGGVGFNHTTIRFKSQRGHGFDFILEIYGH
uniref:Uncharacterized protein n=1 Tax=Phlebotomus papatasi TaxID=29031 RepID=A0A1B0DA18_PHLPP